MLISARRWIWALLAVLLLAGCQGKDGGTGSPAGGGHPAKLAEEPKGEQPGLVYTLSEGSPDGAAAETVKQAQLTPLSEAQVAALLKRMP